MEIVDFRYGLCDYVEIWSGDIGYKNGCGIMRVVTGRCALM